ncbi:MAG: zinc ribbon domain-containing protein [Gammaproteobacteria bacterium]|nr:zinc ribbon domain-containing protein [Gammaproteobacteria bacterium]
MPIYEYQCDACGERVEVMQKISERPLRECPSCRKNKLRKLVSATAFRLKGSGWYETDFKKGGKKNVHVEAEATDSKTGKPEKAEGKPETKDAGTKPESKEKAAEKSALKKEEKPAKAKVGKPAED